MKFNVIYRDQFEVITAHVVRAVVASVLGFTALVSSAQSDWPEVALPKDVRLIHMGSELTINGLPMRIHGFLSQQPPAQVAEWLRKSLGQPLIENHLADKLVLGRMQGDHYISIQLEPSSKGTRGAVAVTNMKLAADKRAVSLADNARWLDRLPAGSRLLSQMRSEDAGKTSTHLVFVNGVDESTNAVRLKSMLADDGLSFERETSANGSVAGSIPVDGRTLYFRGANKEAIAVIARSNGETAVVLNIISQLQRIQ
jgi:hypothetical protein